MIFYNIYINGQLPENFRRKLSLKFNDSISFKVMEVDNFTSIVKAYNFTGDIDSMLLIVHCFMAELGLEVVCTQMEYGTV